MLATNSSSSTTGTNPVLYSTDNGATWNEGVQLSARTAIGYSATNRRFMLASAKFAPNDSNNYGMPWYNYSAFDFSNFSFGGYSTSSLPLQRSLVHDKVCVAGNASGKWVICTGTTNVDSTTAPIQAWIYYSTDGSTFYPCTWSTSPSSTYFKGYFHRALFNGDTCVVIGNCPQWEVSTDGGKTFATYGGGITSGPKFITKTHDRFISGGSINAPTSTVSCLDHALFTSPTSITHVTSSNIGVGGTVTSLVLQDMCYDSEHKRLIAVDKNNHVYWLDVSSGYNFLNWKDAGVVGSSGSFIGIRYGNGVAMMIRYSSGATFYIHTSSDGGATWSLTKSLSVSSRNISDFICSE